MSDLAFSLCAVLYVVAALGALVRGAPATEFTEYLIAAGVIVIAQKVWL